MFHKTIPLLTNTSDTRKLHDDENRWFGDLLPDVEDPHHTRVMFHNVNGLPLHGTEGLEMFIHQQANLQIDIQEFSEHCLATEKFYVTQTANDILRSTFQGQSILQLHSSAEPAIKNYKPGGTGILVLGQTASRLEPHGKGGDSMGRWSYLTLRRKGLPPVTMISVYQVCPRPTNAMGNTAYHQQQRALHKLNRSVHPRTAFMEDLDTFLRTLTKKGHAIILGGDFNESLIDKNSGLLKLATTHHLVDPFLSRFPQHRDFGTHVLGKRRIDSVLVSAQVLQAVTTIGYAPYDFSTPSDHRPLLIDFNTHILFGKTTIHLAPMPSRGVKTKDVNNVRKYIEHTYQRILLANGFNYQQSLDDNSATPQVVELIDDVIGTSEDAAEAKCQKRRPEFYSRTIVRHRLQVSMLKAHLNALKMNKDRTQQLRRKMQRTGIEVPLPLTQRLTQSALRNARNQLQETSRAHFSTRQAELSSQISEAQQQGDGTKLKILKAIQKVEAGQTTYRILQAMRKSHGESPQLDRIEIPASWPPVNQPVTSLDELEDPKTCTAWKLITEPAEIEYYLMVRNRLHFGQAEGTPFTTSPLSDVLDWRATTAVAEHLLQGEHIQTLSTTQCLELLEACKARTDLDCIQPELTMQEFKEKMHVWRETTTTSPSGRHLGRYKALFTSGLPDPDPPPEGTLTFAQKQEAIAALKLSVINYCIRNSYVLKRWKTIVNVMIFKEPGNFRIHRLRVIHIYEADFNLILAVKWRQLLHHADKLRLINGGQYGGRPGCEAQSLTLLEELKYDIAYLSRRTLVNFDNDATSCYDRIPVPLASLINRKYGLHRKIVSVHAATLQEAQFRLKTANGVSDLSYSHNAKFPIHGTGQGSGNSPCIWLLISSTLFDMHAAKSYGAQFVTPDGKTKLSLSMMGFVDDSTGTCNDFQPQTQVPLPTLLQRMESDAQLWNNLLWWSGGKLELPKCSFHVLHFEFDPSGRPRPTLDLFNNHIHVHDSETNERIAIPAKRAFETHKTLGHYKSPITNLRLELSTVQKRANHLALLIATSPITRQGADLAYHTIYIPSVKYSLPQSFYPRRLLDQLQAQSTSRIIAKCGYNRNTARALMFAPKDYAGGGFLPWYLLQGEGQILNFLKHWRTDTIVSKALRIAIHWAQWQSGISSFILDNVSTPIPYHECRWLRSLREFLHTIKAKLIVDSPPIARPERQYDIYIMDYARESKLFTDKELTVINYCRLYLHVTTVSELLTADGKNIIPDLFHCRREPWFDPRTYTSLQRRPTNYHVRYQWQRLCRLWVTSEGKLASSLNLGRWTTPGIALRRRRQTYCTSNPPRVYHWRYGSYWEYCRSASNRSIHVPVQSTTWQPDFASTPVDAQEHSGGILVVAHSRSSLPSVPRPRIPTNFTAYIHTLPPWEQDLLLGVVFLFSPYEIIHRLQTIDHHHKLYLVSDGSLTEDVITYGWVFGTDHGVIYAEHSGCGYGTPTSHRAEAWGMLSATLFLARLLSYTSGFQLPDFPALALFSDNNGLIRRISRRFSYEDSYPTATLEPDWDIVEQIYATTTQLPTCNVTHQWVRGHQDAHSPTRELTVEAQYNIRADLLAGTVCSSSRDSNPSWMLPSERCRLIIDTKPVYGHHIRAIRAAYTVPPFLEYLTQQNNWSDTTKLRVDWESFQRAVSSCPEPHVQLVKLVHDKLPTRAAQSKSQSNVSPTCHYCPADETFAHLLCCDNPISHQFHQDLIEKIEQYFEGTRTPARVRSTFLGSQSLWFGQTQDSSVEDCSPPVYRSQREIGWSLLLRGFFSIQWKQLYTREASHFSGLTIHNPVEFIAGLIKVIWSAQLQFWENHLQCIHHDSTPSVPSLNDKRKEYKARILFLHGQKHLCVYDHRELYFYSNPEEFLRTATISQMKHYLCLYEPAILHSIREAKKNPLRPLFTFPGFSTKRHQPQPIRIPPSSQSTHLNPPPRLKAISRGDLIPHKHTRWKNEVLTRIRDIRNFLRPTPPAT